MQTNELETTLLVPAQEDFSLDEKDLLCEWHSCGAPAEYWLLCPACGSRGLLCGAHTTCNNINVKQKKYKERNNHEYKLLSS